MSHTSKEIDAIGKVHQDFLKIMSFEKCRTCACVYTDMMATILEFIRRVRKRKDDRVLSLAEKDFNRWLKNAELGNLHQ